MSAIKQKYLIAQREIEHKEQEEATRKKEGAEENERKQREKRDEEQLWLDCKKKRTPSVYLDKYPKGRFTESAFNLKMDVEETEKQKRIAEDYARKEKERLAQLEIERKKQEEATRKKKEAEEKERQKQASINQFEPEMIFVKGGTFNRESQKVTLSDFSIGKYPITQAQWQAVMGNNPSHFKGDDNCPVESVSWDDCQEFIKKLNEKTSKKYRLPTEAEWEFAARGGNQSIGYEYSGSNTIDEVAWYDDNSDSKTHSVGTKKANELGIHDMSGNVWEWCNDWYGDYNTKDVIDPKGAEKGSRRVNRGGSWRGSAQACRVAFRSYNTPAYRDDYLGFRVILSP